MVSTPVFSLSSPLVWRLLAYIFCISKNLKKAGEVTLTQISFDLKQACTPLFSCALTLDLWTSRELGRRWSVTRNWAAAGFFRPRVNRKWSSELLSHYEERRSGISRHFLLYCPAFPFFRFVNVQAIKLFNTF